MTWQDDEHIFELKDEINKLEAELTEKNRKIARLVKLLKERAKSYATAREKALEILNTPIGPPEAPE